MFSFQSYGQEDCNNGIDDDGDGLIDLFDDECKCEGGGTTTSTSSLIPNSSFEDSDCCPDRFSMLGCTNNWIQPSYTTPDYWDTACPLPYAVPEPAMPLPGGGSGFVGFYDNWSSLPVTSVYKEYVGSCLSSPMLAGTTYEFDFWLASSGKRGIYSFDFSVYATTSCADTTWAGYSCPLGEGSWVELQSETVNLPNDNGWVNFTYTFTPTQDLYAVSFGPSCGAPSNGYFYLDEMILHEIDSFAFSAVIEPTGSWCNGDLVLTAFSDTIGGTFQWYKDSIALVGETDTVLRVSANNYGAGDYIIKQTVGGNCAFTLYTVEVSDSPLADFESDNDCAVGVTTFTDLSIITTGTISDWAWDFNGDGIVDNTTQNPTYIFPGPGSYSVELIVTSSGSCADTITKIVNIGGGDLAEFDYYDVCEGDDINFIDLSSEGCDTIISWDWTFDATNTSTDQNPTYSYSQDGTYEVVLIVSYSYGLVDTVKHTVVVHPNPIADFQAVDECLSVPVQFNDLSSVSSGIITNWDWSFGDGNTSVVQNPSNAYAEIGTYNNTLIITTSDGCVDSIAKPINIGGGDLAEFDYYDVCEGDAIIFTDLSSEGCDTIISWNWTFDATNTSTDQNPTYSYSQDGTYEVVLIVNYSYGVVDTVKHTVVIHPNPYADFTALPVCIGDSTQFINQSVIPSGSIGSWSWNFGSAIRNPSNIFIDTGYFDVALTVTSDFGCVDSITKQVYVNPLPEVSFIGMPLKGCSPLNSSFTDLSVVGNGNIVAWNWNFGDKTSPIGASDVETPSNSFIDPGFYDVSLRVVSDSGCVADTTFSDYIEIYANPIADFLWSPTELDEFNAIADFTDESADAVVWSWDFAGRDTSTIQHPSHDFEVTGEYDVTLVIENQYGCTDTVTKTIVVNPIYALYLPNAFSPNEDGENDFFFAQGVNVAEFEMWIFNRWGELIFTSENIDDAWDGTYKGSLVQEDVYVWKVRVKDVLGSRRVLYGHVTVVR